MATDVDASGNDDDGGSSAAHSPFTTVAPGRLCFFGEHQDYLHLPVIACAIPLTCRIEVTPVPDSHVLELIVPQLKQEFRYDLRSLPPSPSDDGVMDFALSALHEAIAKDGWKLACGARCVSTTDIPLQSGCSSSTAFCTAWTLVLARLAGRRLSPFELAQRAHRAEVSHFGAPGGTMDHIAIAMGRDDGCLRIGPHPWNDIVELPLLSHGGENDDGAWILADSGEPKDTMKHLKRCKYDRLDLYEQKLGCDWDTDETALELTDEERTLLNATRVNRRTEEEATRLWQSVGVTDVADSTTTTISTESDINSESTGRRLAQLMDTHHAALRDGLGLSTPRMEDMRNAAREAGAWGFKIVGSGGGGCAVAWGPTDRSQNIADAMEGAGAVATWVLDKAYRGAYVVEG